MTIVRDSRAGTPAHGVAATAGTVRRRRVTLGLAAAVAVTAIAAIGTTSPLAWSALSAAIAVTAVYGFMVHRSRRLEWERGFLGLRVPVAAHPNGDFLTHLAEVAIRPEAARELPAPAPSVPAWRRGLAIARFVVSYATGWALAPIVFLLTIAVGRTPKDTTGQRWLANLEATQVRLREQSMRTLVVSAAATASVTGVGAATIVGGAGVAVAAPAAPAAMPSAASAGHSPTPATYTVRAGDTLSSIADRFGTTYQRLAAINHLADPNVIFPGQKLLLRSGATTRVSGAPAAVRTYTVVAGDTLSGIASRFGTTYQMLARINGLSDPNVIQIGEVLHVPGSTGRATSAPTRSAPTRSTSPTRTRKTANRPPVRTSSRAEVAVKTALAEVGKPYQWAGAGPSSFDCSGLVMYAWEAAGVKLAHYTVSQYDETARVSKAQLEPGDLVFYDTGDGAQPGHVTMYIGDGRIVTADSPGTDVRVEALDWDGIPMGFGRVN